MQINRYQVRIPFPDHSWQIRHSYRLVRMQSGDSTGNVLDCERYPRGVFGKCRKGAWSLPCSLHVRCQKCMRFVLISYVAICRSESEFHHRFSGWKFVDDGKHLVCIMFVGCMADLSTKLIKSAGSGMTRCPLLGASQLREATPVVPYVPDLPQTDWCTMLTRF